MKTKIKANINAAVAILSNYNWFKVTVENAGTSETSSFCATGLEVVQDSFIKFHRQFATASYLNEHITDVTAAAENMISFLTEAGNVWTVKGYHNHTLADVDKATGSAEKPETLINWSLTLPTDDGGLFIVLDLRKLGRLTTVQECRIEKFMNVNLKGLGRSCQKCRTIYINHVNDPAWENYMGLYDLENEAVMTRGLYDSIIVTPEPGADQKEWEQMQKVRQLVAYVRAELEKRKDIPF